MSMCINMPGAGRIDRCKTDRNLIDLNTSQQISGRDNIFLLSFLLVFILIQQESQMESITQTEKLQLNLVNFHETFHQILQRKKMSLFS